MEDNRFKIEKVSLTQTSDIVNVKILCRSWETYYPEPDESNPAEYCEFTQMVRYWDNKEHEWKEKEKGGFWNYLHKYMKEEEKIRTLWELNLQVLKTNVIRPLPEDLSSEKSKPIKRTWRNLATGEMSSADGPKLRFRFDKRSGQLHILGPECEGETNLGKIYNVPIETLVEAWDDIDQPLRAVHTSPHTLVHTDRDISMYNPDIEDSDRMGEITDYDLWIEKQTEGMIWMNLILKDERYGRYLVKFKVRKVGGKNAFRKLRADNREKRKNECTPRRGCILEEGSPHGQLNSPVCIQLPHHRRVIMEYMLDDLHVKFERFGYDVYVTSYQGRIQGFLRYRPEFDLVVENYMNYKTETGEGRIVEFDNCSKAMKFVKWVRKYGTRTLERSRSYKKKCTKKDMFFYYDTSGKSSEIGVENEFEQYNPILKAIREDRQDEWDKEDGVEFVSSANFRPMTDIYRNKKDNIYYPKLKMILDVDYFSEFKKSMEQITVEFERIMEEKKQIRKAKKEFHKKRANCRMKTTQEHLRERDMLKMGTIKLSKK